MSYLTRFHIDPRSRGGARYLGDPHRLHAAIYGAMLTQPVQVAAGGRPLWRIDRDDPRAPLLWVASAEAPNLDNLADEAGRSVHGQVYETRSYTPLLEQLGSAQLYAFRFTGNATRAGRRAPDSPRTQRFGHVTPAQQVAWLERQATAHGFELAPTAAGEPDVAVVGRQKSVFYREGRRVVIAVTDFGGHLRVTDPARLRRALTGGIGHARAYGCGLLTLAPAR